MNSFEWYAQLIKPSWSPPAWLFGPVWTVLYVLIVISFGKVFLMAGQKQVLFMVALPFILNLVFNLAFTPLQFGLRNNLLASIDIILILATLVWAMAAIYPHYALDHLYPNPVFNLGFFRDHIAADNNLP